MSKKPPFYRNCPECKTSIEYKSVSGFWKGNRKNSLCRPCSSKKRDMKGSNNPFWGKKHTEETKKRFRERDCSACQTPEFRAKMSKICSGVGNPMYGRKVYDVWVQKYGIEEADRRLAITKKKHSRNNSGSGNPMYGKPASKGAGNGWSGWYKTHYFRSLRELTYIIMVLEPNMHQWHSAENIRITYVNYDNKHRTYSPDFIVDGTKLIEIKPKKLHESPSVKLKTDAAKKFCRENNLVYQLIDIEIAPLNILFDLYQQGLIKFLPLYEQKFLRYYEQNCIDAGITGVA